MQSMLGDRDTAADTDDVEDDLVDKTHPDLVRLWRAWRTVREMCADRGYEFTDEELQISLAEFKRQYAFPDSGLPNRSLMNFSARPSAEMLRKFTDPPTPSDPDPKPRDSDIGTIWVEFNGDDSVGIKALRQFAHHISSHNFHTGIFVSASNVTPSAMKIVPTVLPHVIEVFNESELLVNITKHELVPKHVLLSKEEKNALLERYRVKETQLPRIQVGDPVARSVKKPPRLLYSLLLCDSIWGCGDRKSSRLYANQKLLGGMRATGGRYNTPAWDFVLTAVAMLP